jgi:hypothetical protein
MSAAATAAGYLYASGRLRGRGAREGTEGEHGDRRREIKVAVYPSNEHQQQPREQEQAVPARPARTPKIQYRTRRWRPE